MTFVLALTPIILILTLMVGFRWSAARAGSIGYLSALVIAMTAFGAGIDLIGYAHTRAIFLALDVLLIIWAAFLLYRVADEAGAIKTIARSLPYLTADKGMQALLIGWVFASFLQGVGGFGVPVAVVAPILVGLGFAPLAAVVIPSIGHGWAVTFGSMGSSFQSLMASTGLVESVLAPAAAIFLGIACPVVGFMVAHAAGGWAAVKRLAFPVLILGVVMGTVQFLVATAGFWYIAAFIAGLAGLVLGILLAARSKSKHLVPDQQTQAGPDSSSPGLDMRVLMIALSGYVILIAVILLVQLVPVVKQTLGSVTFQMAFPEVKTSLGFTVPPGYGRKIVLFRHTGMILIYASILAYLVYKKAGLYQKGSVSKILSGTVRRVMSSSVSIISMVAMAVIMENSGMTDALARGLALGTGRFFPFMSPWIGALGAFMTGSNTNSNVVFGALQLKTALLLGYSPVFILAAQTAGAALASIMAPTKVVVGASTASMAGKEGIIMRKLLVYTVPLIVLVGACAMAATWLYTP